MSKHENFATLINGRKYLLTYKDRNGDFDAAGFGYTITDPETEKSVGHLRVLIYGTASTMWANNTKFPYGDMNEAVDTVMAAIHAVIPRMNFVVNEAYFDAMAYRGDNITVQITTLDDAVAEQGALITLKSYDSPEKFVAMHLFDGEKNGQKIRDAILRRLNDQEEQDYSSRYTTKELQADLFLDRTTVQRATDYLAGAGVEYISKTPAGDDEYILKLNPKGIDHISVQQSEPIVEKGEVRTVPIDIAVKEGLMNLDSGLGSDYEQLVIDLNDHSRRSWKGQANELREILSGTLRILAPDKEVMRSEGFLLEKGRDKPTQKQKVQHILRKRSASDKESDVVKEVGLFEERLGIFFRKFYDRTNRSTHGSTERKKLIKIYSYFLAFLKDLLDV